jgi:hypothetical protein
VDVGLPEKHFEGMHFGRRRPVDREFSDYSTVAQALQKRGSEKKLCMPIEPGITDQSAARAYQPEERLAERGEKTRELVEDAAGIPRTWKPELSSVQQDEASTLHVALWANLGTQALVAYVISEIIHSGDLAARLILLGFDAAAATALAVCANRYLSRSPALAGISLVVAVGELLALTICASY